jgi:anaerobic selenocysteine-containing dehydrogenase
MESATTTVRTCPLCEATCGLELTIEDGRVVKVRGDADDVFSRGFLCPKGVSLMQLHDDPDRLRAPLVRGADGTLAEATWDEAFAAVESGLRRVVEAGGRDAVAAYLGNPSAHNLGAAIYGRVLLKALGTKNIFSASTVDQYPKQIAAAHMFGTAVSVPVPDVDRTDMLLVLGANPLASNGSLMTAPDMRGRLRALRARGGRLVVVDPRRTRTAREADEHLFIRPGTDAFLLAAIAHVLFEEDRVDLGDAGQWTAGLDAVRDAVAAVTPERAATATGIDADTIRRLARELSDAESAAVYGRIGTTTQTFGTTTSWLVDVVNALTGNLDRPGGAMFTLPVSGSPNTSGEPGRGRGARPARYASRVRGLGEVLGELPVACLAEEIETPGDGQVRALITLAGNPAVSTPNADRLSRALASLDFMVSVDIYLNETTRHADVVLPVPSPFERSHYDLFLYPFAIRDVANYSAPTFDPPAGMPHEWETLLRLVGAVTGQGADADVAAIDDFIAAEAVRRECGTTGSPVEGQEADAVLAALAPRRGPERILDLSLRCGPFGAGFPEIGAPGPGLARATGGGASGDEPLPAAAEAAPEGVSLDALLRAPHGIDLGPLKPRLPEVLRTPSGKVELAPEALLADVERLVEELDAAVERATAVAAGAEAQAGSNGEGAGAGDAFGSAGRNLLLVGRRDLRSNNSWMHNLPLLVDGPERCTLHVHPVDAAALGLVDGARAEVRSRAGGVEVAVTVTDDVMRGVVSLPHGWGHDVDGVRMGVAGDHAGVNSNVLTDETVVEPITGTAVLNGIPVTVSACGPAPGGARAADGTSRAAGAEVGATG